MCCKEKKNFIEITQVKHGKVLDHGQFLDVIPESLKIKILLSYFLKHKFLQSQNIKCNWVKL